MARIVECVPNFSEGQHKEVIEAIANAIASTDGCNLLDVDPGISTNRTVYTFVGTPEAVIEGALNGSRAAAQLIDMTKHSGEHPRIGALDVCPFIPVKNVTMEDCVECAREFGERLAAEIGVPVYLYGEAATEDHRKTVPQIRLGEYEGLPEKLVQPEWKPDFGPAEFVPYWGATLAGARKFLIAYNVNLLSTKEQAHRIALNIREQGRGKDEPGRLQKVQAIGWYLEEANMAQVSVNITDHEVTPIHKVYEEVLKDSLDLNLAVVGSQVVGLVPLVAIMQAADYYMEKEGLFILEEDQKIRLVVDRLGLHSLGGFNPKERIIEYMISDEPTGPLASMDLRDFVFTIGARSPSPGGGSVSALVATMGAALGTMVGFLTYGNKKFQSLDSEMRKLIPPLYTTMKDLLPYVDHDAAAFNEYMCHFVPVTKSEEDALSKLGAAKLDTLACTEMDAESLSKLGAFKLDPMAAQSAAKMPKKDDLEEQLREKAMQRALHNAVAVPMNVAKTTNSMWPHLTELAKIGNINCKSDVQVGVRCLETGVWGAYYNVITNLDDIKDEEFKTKVKEDIEKELKTAQEGCAAILKIMEERKS